MKISFTQKEYRLLMELIYIASWVMTSCPSQKTDEAYFKLCRKLCALYQDMGADSFIKYDEKYDMYRESEKFKNPLHKKYIHPYNDKTFWNHLMLSLTQRDLREKFGEQELQTMNTEHQSRTVRKIVDQYEQEFEKNGLNNVRVIHSAVNDDYFELKID